MGYLQPKLSDKSIISTNPQIWSDPGKKPDGSKVVSSDNVCRLYVDNWVSDSKDKLPTGFIPNNEITKLLSNPTTSIVSQTTPYIRFMIDAIDSSFNETISPLKNLSEGFATYSFGQEPPVFNFSGVLLHTRFDNWSELFMSLYIYFLRASKLAQLSIINKKKYQVVFEYQNKRIKGSIVSLRQSDNAINEQAVSFGISFLVKEIEFNWETVDSTPTLLADATSDSFNTNKQQADAALRKGTSPYRTDGNNTKDNPAVTVRT